MAFRLHHYTTLFLSTLLITSSFFPSLTLGAGQYEKQNPKELLNTLPIFHNQVTPINPIFSELWDQALTTVPSYPSPRELLGHFLHHSNTHLESVWNTYSKDIQNQAKNNAMKPKNKIQDDPNPLPGPYWRWVPEYLDAAVPNSTTFTFSSPCFANNTAVATFSSYGVHVELTASNQVGIAGCNDYYLTGTVEWLNLVNVVAPGTYPIDFPIGNNVLGSREWVTREGVRIFRFLDSEPYTTLWEALATISLFIPALISSPPDIGSTDRNLDFLHRYVNITYLTRPPAAANLTIDPSLFQSGDLLAIHRADGLSTIESWGTGATTSHITMFMRDEITNELWVVESNAKGADWPIDHIQKNLWDDWVTMAKQAGYGVVWLPMTDSARQTFNVTSAWQFINSTLGKPYGYVEFASTFYDTERDNLPWPATPEALEVVIAIVAGVGIPFSDPMYGSWNLIDLLFTLSLTFKLGLPYGTNLTFIEALNTAAGQGLTFGQLVAKPEQDTWLYGNMSVARVCDAYYCSVVKAGGVFGSLTNSINCAEFENSGVYQLFIFDPAPTRPQACQDVDPAPYPFCQLLGAYQIPLPKVGTNTPYAHMMETCPSLPTEYLRTPGC